MDASLANSDDNVFNGGMDFYFDNAATTVMSERAREAYIRTAQEFIGNPSSLHREGRKAKDELERRRASIASCLGVQPSSLVFTSGATESIALVFQSLLWQEPGHVVISRIEHEAVSSWSAILEKNGWSVTRLRARGGFVSPDELRDALRSDTRLVAIMAVNNVTGAIQDTDALVKTVREHEKAVRHRVFFFSDSVQALGKTGLDLASSDVDGASFSSHKINGPRGVGMLYLRNRDSIRLIAPAGGQEGGKRGGTENLPGIAAFAEAVSEWYEDRRGNEERIAAIKREMKEKLIGYGLQILSPENSSPYILSFATPFPSEVFTRMLDDKGFSISSGSACSNNAKGKSESIYEAMGIRNNIASHAVRVSFSKDTKEEEASALADAIKEIIHG